MKIDKSIAEKISELCATTGNPPVDTHGMALHGLDDAFMRIAFIELDEDMAWAICCDETTGEIIVKMLPVDDTCDVPYRAEDGLVVCHTTVSATLQDIADAVFVAMAVLSGENIDSDPELRAAAVTKCMPVYGLGNAALAMSKHPYGGGESYAIMYDILTHCCWVDVYDSDDPIRTWPNDGGPYVLCTDRPYELLCGVYKELPKMRAIHDDVWAYRVVEDRKNGTLEQAIYNVIEDAMFKIAEIRDRE